MKRMLYRPKPKGIRKWYGDIKDEIQIRKEGLTIEGIEYINVENAQTVFGTYQLIPVTEKKGLYRVEEIMIAEESLYRKRVAEKIKNEAEKEKYLSEKPIHMQNTRRMYITADYSAIKQLKSEMGIQAEGQAMKQFKALVERNRIKRRIAESGDKIARAIYEEGMKTTPRTLGYIGGLTGRKGHIKRIYNLNDPRAQEVNQAIFEGLLRGNKRLRDYYEDRQL